jgi:hypothetical protein
MSVDIKQEFFKIVLEVSDSFLFGGNIKHLMIGNETIG